MKLHFIILFFFLYQINYSQNNIVIEKETITLDPHYFILGTLSDYLGHFAYVDKEKQIDKYYPYEKPLADYLTEYIKEQLNIEVETIFKSSLHSEMFSEELSKKLNNFYGENGELMDEKFKTLNQKYSFITGIYYRDGYSNSGIRKIQLANSPKHQNCYKLLMEIGCKNIFYQYIRGFPTQYILYFEPTTELKKYFELIEKERINLRESHFKSLIESMGDVMSKEELKTYIYKDFEKVKAVFEK